MRSQDGYGGKRGRSVQSDHHGSLDAADALAIHAVSVAEQNVFIDMLHWDASS